MFTYHRGPQSFAIVRMALVDDEKEHACTFHVEGKGPIAGELRCPSSDAAHAVAEALLEINVT